MLFWNCTGLAKAVFVSANPPAFDADVFTNTSAALKCYVLAGSKVAYEAALTGKTIEEYPVVGISQISGITPPAAGEAPVTTIVETAEVTGTVEWSPAGSAFAPDTVYTATVTLTRKDGFPFGGTVENFFTAAGAATTNRANSGVITAVFPKTGHIFDKEIVDGRYLKSAADCKNVAVYYKSCECGEHGTATFESGEKNPSNHTNIVRTAAKAATHLAVGNSEYWYCKGCDKYFSDAAGTVEIVLADTIVQRLSGHTADASGIYSDKNGHWHICDCGEKIDTAAHSFGDWTVTKEAAATEKGSKERFCADCGYKETEDIAATGDYPKTGDNSNVWLWIVLLFVSGGAVTALGITGKKRRRYN